MKVRSMLLLSAGVLVGGTLLFVRRASASTSGLVLVDGKLGALATGAQIMAGGTWIVVASTKDRWPDLRVVIEARALENASVRWVLADMDMLRKEADGRGVIVPTDAWGGVAFVSDGEVKNYSYFYGSIAHAVAQIGEPGGLQSSGSNLGFMSAFVP